MSRSILKDKYMRRYYTGRSCISSHWDDPIRNHHRQDEMPKNSPSRLVLSHCSANVSWLEDSTSFGGHSRPHGGHRRVSGLVRASLKCEQRKEMLEQLAEYYFPHTDSDKQHMITNKNSLEDINPDSLATGLIIIEDDKEEGQSTYGADLAFLFAVDNRIPTIYYSLDKKEEDLVSILLNKLCSQYKKNVAILSAATQKEWDSIQDGIIRLSKSPLYIDDSTDLTIDMIHTLERVAISEKKERLIIIDGIHLLEEENPIQRLESMAAELDVTIIALQKHMTQ